MIYVKKVNVEISTKHGQAQETRANTEKSPEPAVQFSQYLKIPERNMQRYLVYLFTPSPPNRLLCTQCLLYQLIVFFSFFTQPSQLSGLLCAGYFLGGGASRNFQERRSCELLPIFLQLRSRHPLPHPNYNNKDSTRRLNPPATQAIFHSLAFKGAYTARVPVNGKCASVLAALALSTLFFKVCRFLCTYCKVLESCI